VFVEYKGLKIKLSDEELKAALEGDAVITGKCP
jgi:hypothetical protein